MPQHSFTLGIDVGDRHSHLCLLDTHTGEVVEESRIATSPAAFERRFSGGEKIRVAVEAGTHSPWISRLLEGCGHEVLVANARKLRLIYADGGKNDRLDAENLARLARLDPRLLSRSSAAARPRRPTWLSSARARPCWREDQARKPRARRGQILRGPPAQVQRRGLPPQGPRARARGARPRAGTTTRYDRLAHRAHPRVRPRAGGRLPRALPGETTHRKRGDAPGRAERAVDGRSRSDAPHTPYATIRAAHLPQGASGEVCPLRGLIQRRPASAVPPESRGIARGMVAVNYKIGGRTRTPSPTRVRVRPETTGCATQNPHRNPSAKQRPETPSRGGSVPISTVFEQG